MYSLFYHFRLHSFNCFIPTQFYISCIVVVVSLFISDSVKYHRFFVLYFSREIQNDTKQNETLQCNRIYIYPNEIIVKQIYKNPLRKIFDLLLLKVNVLKAVNKLFYGPIHCSVFAGRFLQCFSSHGNSQSLYTLCPLVMVNHDTSSLGFANWALYLMWLPTEMSFIKEYFWELSEY